MTQTHYDEIVIGSSPLMLIHAIHAAREGRSVAIIERDEAPGGLWKLTRVENGILTETACHLIEDFPGVYDYLADLTGIPFESLDSQPLRLTPTGIPVRYSSRVTVLAAVVKATLKLIKYRLKSMRGPLSEREVFSTEEARLKVLDFTRYLIPRVVLGFNVKAPTTGFADFINRLVERANASGARFVTDDVATITRGKGGWQVETTSGARLTATSIRCSASATVKPTGDEALERFETEDAEYQNTLLEVPADSIVKNISYALYPNDDYIMRVSRVDQRPEDRVPGLLYLFQFWKREQMPDSERIAILAGKLKRAGIIEADQGITMLGNIEGAFTPYDQSKQLPEGELFPNFFVYSSAGNLSSGLANWLRGRYRMRSGTFEPSRMR